MQGILKVEVLLQVRGFPGVKNGSETGHFRSIIVFESEYGATGPFLVMQG